jgi:hypothetical protein
MSSGRAAAYSTARLPRYIMIRYIKLALPAIIRDINAVLYLINNDRTIACDPLEALKGLCFQ